MGECSAFKNIRRLVAGQVLCGRHPTAVEGTTEMKVREKRMCSLGGCLG